MHARAPGKIILSGEHSVVYGAPALALAVDRYIDVTFTPDAQAGALTLELPAFASSLILSTQQLRDLPCQLNEGFERFLQGELAINELVSHPATLLAYVLAVHCPDASQLSGTLKTQSDITPGAGMGSSAAVIAAVQCLAEKLSGKSLSPEARLERVRYCERLQHGRGSALDAAAVTYGGLLQLHQDRVTPLLQMPGQGWYQICTGTPQVSTGEVVQAVRDKFADDALLWQAFAAVTEQLVDHLEEPDLVLNLIAENHRLLEYIGVVPAPVSEFIARLEQQGAAAKISGAGAHTGEGAGVVLVYAPHLSPAQMDSLAAQSDYTSRPLTGVSEGAHLLAD